MFQKNKKLTISRKHLFLALVWTTLTPFVFILKFWGSGYLTFFNTLFDPIILVISDIRLTGLAYIFFFYNIISYIFFIAKFVVFYLTISIFFKYFNFTKKVVVILSATVIIASQLFFFLGIPYLFTDIEENPIINHLNDKNKF